MLDGRSKLCNIIYACGVFDMASDSLAGPGRHASKSCGPYGCGTVEITEMLNCLMHCQELSVKSTVVSFWWV